MSEKHRFTAKSKMVPFDGEALQKEIFKAGATEQEVSMRIGTSSSYISNCRSKGLINYTYLQKVYSELAKGGFEGKKTVSIHKRTYSAKKVDFDIDDMRRRIKESGRDSEDLAEASGTCKGTLIYWVSKGSMPKDVYDRLEEQLGREEVQETAVAVTEKVYTEAAVKEIIRQTINAFADHMIDYFSDLLDKEGV